MLSLLYNIGKVCLILILPFCLLIRSAVYFHFDKGLPSYLSLGLSAAITSILLLIYFQYIYGSITKQGSNIRYLRRRFTITLVIVMGFILHGVFYISSSNTKSTSINEEFSSLNPILRLGCSTLFLLDKRSIITDAARVPEDYHKMGLKSKNQSLHYKQKDGYVYALDLRTRDRSELRNISLKAYFFLMGFKSLRHIGTADHLHISMPCRYLKGAK